MRLDILTDLHKNQSQQLIEASTQTLTIRLPVSRTSSNVNPLFGQFSRETDTSGETVGPVKCLWHDGLSVRTMNQMNSTGIKLSVSEMAGQYSEATAFAEVWLEDVLIDVNQPNGETWFDRAKEVLHDGAAYKVLGVLRTGLATVPPYLALIAVKGSTGYDA